MAAAAAAAASAPTRWLNGTNECVFMCLRMFKLLILWLQAIAGDAEMDDVLEEIAQSLHIGRLPRNWSTLAPETRKRLGDWLEHLKVSNNRSHT